MNAPTLCRVFIGRNGGCEWEAWTRDVLSSLRSLSRLGAKRAIWISLLSSQRPNRVVLAFSGRMALARRHEVIIRQGYFSTPALLRAHPPREPRWLAHRDNKAGQLAHTLAPPSSSAPAHRHIAIAISACPCTSLHTKHPFLQLAPHAILSLQIMRCPS